MQIFNTLTRQKEEFVPQVPGEYRIYVCGPTVYNYIHIGNARPLIVFDTLRRYLEYRGNKVTFVQNFTDVDDKIIKRANEEGTTSQAISEKYIDEYFKDAHGLGVRDATIHPKATENIQQIIDLVQTLIDKGYAYAVNGDVYYRTKKFADYGKLSHQPIEELQAGARIDVNDVKEDPLDFALWKSAKPGEPYWESPWGKGRPGWHIECSAMSEKYIPLDIHGGGLDLIFPHHENEIAQTEAALGKPLANIWMHNGFVQVDSEKMSKSLGNFKTIRDILESYLAETLRYFLAGKHYRSPIDFSLDNMDESERSQKRVYECLREVDKGLVEAAQSMGATNMQIITKVLLPEAMPGIVAGLTISIISLILIKAVDLLKKKSMPWTLILGYSAMAGAVGGGGLGDLGIRYGYQRFMPEVMWTVVIVLIILVQGIQSFGDWIVRRISHK